MFSHQKWKCSWSQIATVASVIVLVSLVHLFLGPVVPSFDSISVRQAQNLRGPSNESITQVTKEEPVVAFDRRFPADLHGAVVYRNASWKAEIGQWLSSCDAVAKEVDIIEVSIILASLKQCLFVRFGYKGCVFFLFFLQPIGGRKCLNDCSGQGVCNHEFGMCRCFHGFNG